MDNNKNKNRGEFGSDPAEGTSHPVGEGVGTVAGATAGGIAGSVAGPIGTAAGALIGGIAGWLEGRTIAEGVNPDAEMTYWKGNYKNASYYDKDYDWDDYETAYTYGLYSYDRDREFDDAEPDMEREWDEVRGSSRLTWPEAREASKDVWTRLGKSRR